MCVVQTSCTKSVEAAKKYGLKSIALGGGVSCNSLIRDMFKKECKKNKINVFLPSPVFCTDNAAMVAHVAYHKALKKKYVYPNKQVVSIKPSLELENW